MVLPKFLTLAVIQQRRAVPSTLEIVHKRFSTTAFSLAVTQIVSSYACFRPATVFGLLMYSIRRNKKTDTVAGFFRNLMGVRYENFLRNQPSAASAEPKSRNGAGRGTGGRTSPFRLSRVFRSSDDTSDRNPSMP